MNRRFGIYLLSFLLAHTPLAFAPQSNDSDHETQDESSQPPVACASVDASNSDDSPSQTKALATVTLATGETPLHKNLQNVRHVCLHKQHIPAKDFEALATAKLLTLDLSDATLLIKPETLGQAHSVFFQLHKLTTLTDLNLARFSIPTGAQESTIGALVQARTDRNPISFLVNLEKLNLKGAGFWNGAF